MKQKFIILMFVCLISFMGWADDHAEYLSFRDQAMQLIKQRDYKNAEQRLDGAEFFATSSIDKSDYNNIISKYNKILSADLDSAKVCYKNGNFEQCVNILLPLLETRKDRDVQWWIGQSYANMKMPILAKKFLEYGISKYDDSWCAYSLGWLYNHTTDKSIIGISGKNAKYYLEKGSSVTKAAFDELGYFYEQLNLFDLAIDNYKKADSKRGVVKISNFILDGYASLPDNEALNFITLAANDGDLNSLYGLGLIYYNGEFGVKKDRQKGRSLVQQASQKGHKKAKSILYKLSSY